MLKTLSNFKPLLQSDYGKDMDCSLTSITACIFYYTNGMKHDFKDADIKCKNIYKERKCRNKFYDKMSMFLAEAAPCATLEESDDYFDDIQL